MALIGWLARAAWSFRSKPFEEGSAETSSPVLAIFATMCFWELADKSAPRDGPMAGSPLKVIESLSAALGRSFRFSGMGWVVFLRKGQAKPMPKASTKLTIKSFFTRLTILTYGAWRLDWPL